jgi:hypothetical protein
MQALRRVVNRNNCAPPRNGASRSAWRVLIWFCALMSSAVLAEESLLRVTCNGVFRLSDDEPTLRCAEDGLLTDAAGGLMFAYSVAAADRARAEIQARAAGGVMRDAGYIDRAASALMLQSYELEGDWQGTLPVTIKAKVRYGFGGTGHARAIIALRSSMTGNPRGANRAVLWMTHTEFGGTALTHGDTNTGRYAMPEAGAYPSRSLLDISVVELVPAERATVAIRVDLFVYAMPALASLGTSIFAVADVALNIEFEAPCPLVARSADGHMAARLISAETSRDWQCLGPTDTTDATP